jgi:nuclease S1
MHRFLVLLLLGSLWPAPVLGWSAQGHRIVGELAERQLSPHAREEVRRLLRGLEDPSLAGVSVWADEVRPQEPWRHTAPWHYVNFPDLHCDYDPARDCRDGRCIIDAINAHRHVLADRGMTVQQRRQALKFLVHFVGDIHQPMHAGLREDRGGNDFQLRYRRQGMNLHAVWDGVILRSREPDWRRYVELLEATPGPGPDPTLHSDNPARDWAIESCRIITDHGLYPERRGARIDSTYLDRHRPVAEQRLLQAGERLARLLEEALVD